MSRRRTRSQGHGRAPELRDLLRKPLQPSRWFAGQRIAACLKHEADALLGQLTRVLPHSPRPVGLCRPRVQVSTEAPPAVCAMSATEAVGIEPAQRFRRRLASRSRAASAETRIAPPGGSSRATRQARLGNASGESRPEPAAGTEEGRNACLASRRLRAVQAHRQGAYWGFRRSARPLCSRGSRRPQASPT